MFLLAPAFGLREPGDNQPSITVHSIWEEIAAINIYFEGCRFAAETCHPFACQLITLKSKGSMTGKAKPNFSLPTG
jgi:hypothetical protein